MRPSAVLAVLPLALAGPAPARGAQPAPLLVPRGAGAQAVAGKYIVKLRAGRAAVVDGLLRSISREAEHVYQGIFSGFAATLDGEALAAVRASPDVEFVEQDAVVTASGLTTQGGAPWGLGRISHRRRGSQTYAFDAGAGAGTCAYVLDTGIDDSHPGFGGRAQQVWSASGLPPRDGHGHGTHVAGTVGSDAYGVAKRTQLLGVKVLDDGGRGNSSVLIAGMQFVADDMARRRCPAGVVVNMSLNGPTSAAVNSAARALVAAGAFVGVAAGNDNADAARRSPASEPAVCTVGGTAPDDTRYPRSNWGPAVDVLAPAVDVLSLRPGGGVARHTGTSMAAPHVVGLAAYLGALEGLKGTDALCSRIKALATRDAISDQPPGTVNLLAFNDATP